MRDLAARTALVLAIVIGGLALWQMREAVELLVLALAVAAGLSPLTQRLVSRGMRPVLAIALVFAGTLAMLALGALLLGSLAAAELALLAERLPAWYDRQRAWLLGGAGWAVRLGELLPTSSALTAAAVSGGPGEGGDVGTVVVDLTSTVIKVATLVVGAASLGFYWLLDQQRIERLWLSLLPLNARAAARAVWTQLYAEVGSYVRVTVVVTALTTVALLSVFTLLGLPGATLLALFAGLAQVAPLVGPAVALLVATATGASVGTLTGALTAAGTGYVLLVVRRVIEPRLLEGMTRVNPVLVVLLILVLAELGGIWLVLLAPPLAAALQASGRALFSQQRVVAAQSQSQRLDDLLERLAQVERQAQDDAQLRDLVARARRLVDETAASVPLPAAAVSSAEQLEALEVARS